jgi:hypothetical protein
LLVRTVRILAAAALLPLAMAWTGGSSAASRAERRDNAAFVGTVSGSRAFVAMAVSNSRVIAYVCDSRRIAHWFRGPVRGGKATLASGGYVLRAIIGPHRARGSVSFPDRAGDAHAFTADMAAKPAGLYRGEKTVAGTRYLGGWIILPDGRQRGEVVSGSTDVASPILNPSDPTVDVKKGKKRPLIVIIAILIG